MVGEWPVGVVTTNAAEHADFFCAWDDAYFHLDAAGENVLGLEWERAAGE